jgi:hypothetical protein
MLFNWSDLLHLERRPRQDAVKRKKQENGHRRPVQGTGRNVRHEVQSRVHACASEQEGEREQNRKVVGYPSHTYRQGKSTCRMITRETVSPRMFRERSKAQDFKRSRSRDLNGHRFIQDARHDGRTNRK